MKILVVGSGGREHALVWKIKQSSQVEKIYCVPGNAGIAQIAVCINIKAEDIKGILDFAKKEKIDLTVVGPEAPLVAGIVDEFEKAGLKIFGPTKAAARLEGSKVFAKEFMAKHCIPTARFKVFDDSQKAKDYLEQINMAPVVIKADGLAAGKGVIVARSVSEAVEAIDKIMVKKEFGDCGNRVIVEECLEGEELSLLAISDGKNYCLLDSSQDHKRINDDDQGPNTGGMGAYSPTSILNEDMLKEIKDDVFKRAINGMLVDENRFKGLLYAGLMITKDGPKVLEFNVRFGDPETQVILPRLKDNLIDIMLKSTEPDGLKDVALSWDERVCVCVVLASGGYPNEFEKGKVISGLSEIKDEMGTYAFHAGTQFKQAADKKEIVTSGGRVLGVAALGANIQDAIKNAYDAVAKISFDKMHYRKDIGKRAIKIAEEKAKEEKK